MTFYVIDFENPYNSIATLSGYSVEEAAKAMEEDRDFRGCVLMTAEELNRFRKKLRFSDRETKSERQELYDSMKDTFIYEKFLKGDYDSKISYSFWVTSAYDSYTTIFAVGADTVGGYEFNLNRIAKRLGERYFYNYVAGRGKRVKDFSTLVRILKENGVRDINFTKEDLIEACNNDKYLICRN